MCPTCVYCVIKLKALRVYFGRQSNVLKRITEPSNDEYDNNVSDNCDYKFSTFDDFGVKDYQKSMHIT